MMGKVETVAIMAAILQARDIPGITGRDEPEQYAEDALELYNAALGVTQAEVDEAAIASRNRKARLGGGPGA